MIYKLYRNPRLDQITGVIKIEENYEYNIPFDITNSDYQEYISWLAEGNTPESAET